MERDRTETQFRIKFSVLQYGKHVNKISSNGRNYVETFTFQKTNILRESSLRYEIPPYKKLIHDLNILYCCRQQHNIGRTDRQTESNHIHVVIIKERRKLIKSKTYQFFNIYEFPLNSYFYCVGKIYPWLNEWTVSGFIEQH